jgi:inorganic pyrophosphatase
MTKNLSVLHSPLHYPLDYGFIPQTRSEGGDHLDVILSFRHRCFPDAS